MKKGMFLYSGIGCGIPTGKVHHGGKKAQAEGEWDYPGLPCLPAISDIVEHKHMPLEYALKVTLKK